ESLMRQISTVSAVLAALATAASAPASAQSTGSRWAAYAGCWEQSSAEGQALPDSIARVCIVPAGGAADLITVTHGTVAERTRIDADGEHRETARNGCRGWETAFWSADGRRLFLKSDQTCGDVRRLSSGLFAIDVGGTLTNVVNVDAGGGKALRVLRYAP